MKGKTMLETNIQGCICTNSNREIVAKWRGDIERSLGSLDLSFFDGQKISVELKATSTQKKLNFLTKKKK